MWNVLHKTKTKNTETPPKHEKREETMQQHKKAFGDTPLSRGGWAGGGWRSGKLSMATIVLMGAIFKENSKEQKEKNYYSFLHSCVHSFTYRFDKYLLC